MGNLRDTLTVPLNEKESLEACIQKGPFDRALRALQDRNFDLSSPHELAEGRIALGPKGEVSREDIVVAESFVYLPDGRILVVSRHDSPILMAPAEATKAHRNQKPLYLEEKWVNYLLSHASEDPRKALETGVLFLRRKDARMPMQTNAMEEHPLGYFLWREQAKPYGDLLRRQCIKEVTICTVSGELTKNMEPFAAPLTISSLTDGSRVNASHYRDLYKKNHLCGLRHVPISKYVAQAIPR